MFKIVRAKALLGLFLARAIVAIGRCNGATRWAVRFVCLVFITGSPAAAQTPLVIDNYPQYATSLNSAQQARLRALAAEIAADLANHSRVAVVVDGHADFDAQGASFEHQKSLERANDAASELRRLIAEEGHKIGLSPAQIDAVTIETAGLGTERAIHRNPSTLAERAQNRRVEIGKTVSDILPPPDNVPPEVAASPKYQFYQEYRRKADSAITGPSDSESLVQYAEKCQAATGIAIPKFSCSSGVDVPGQDVVNGKCNFPNVLNGACDPGSRFQVLPGGTADAVAVAHCRKVGLPKAGNLYRDIAIIQYNKQNGAICFYQALSATVMPGDDIPSPIEKTKTLWTDNKVHWMSPSETNGTGCPACHDNGGFLRSPYLAQLKAGPNVPPNHVFPNYAQGFDNADPTKLRYVGNAFSSLKSWSIETANAEGDGGASCTSCHRLAVSNHPWVVTPVIRDGKVVEVSTARTFGVVATAPDQASKTIHGPQSPIWMRPPSITFDQGAYATAMKYRACAESFIQSVFTAVPQGCTKTPLGKAWGEP